jgi:hypothetical protein
VDELRARGGAVRAFRQMPVELGHMRGVQLAVVPGLEHQAVAFAILGHALILSARADISARRARHSRDITVPTGTPVTRAMSR